MSIDTNSQTWREIEEWATNELARARSQLESPQTDHVTTQSLRYEIVSLKNLLNLPKKGILPGQQPTEG